MLRGPPPTGLHFGSEKDYIPESLFKEARYKIVFCVLYYIDYIIHYKSFAKILTRTPLRQLKAFMTSFYKYRVYYIIYITHYKSFVKMLTRTPLRQLMAFMTSF